MKPIAFLPVIAATALSLAACSLELGSDTTTKIEQDSRSADGVLRDDTLVVTGTCDGNCSVGFDVDVPDGVDVSVITFDGAVELSGLAGSIDVRTEDGSIEIAPS